MAFATTPYRIDLSQSGMPASAVLDSGDGLCVPKAVLLAASCRAVEIPARLGFADVRSHPSTKCLRETMGTDFFIWHGHTDIWLDGEWRVATPAFNIELCQRFGLVPLAFNGRNDSVYHPFDLAGNKHMEYVNQRGHFNDLPLAQIAADVEQVHAAWMVEPSDPQTTSFEQDLDHETRYRARGIVPHTTCNGTCRRWCMGEFCSDG